MQRARFEKDTFPNDDKNQGFRFQTQQKETSVIFCIYKNS